MIPIISINKLVEHCMPVVFKDKHYYSNNLYQWLVSLVKPIKTSYEVFKLYRNATLYELQHTGQVLSLEHQLNGYYNLPFPVDTAISIWIEEGIKQEDFYIFNNGVDADDILNIPKEYVFNRFEEIDLGFEEHYVFSELELTTDEIDFIVNVPNTITNLDYIKTTLNKYKLAGYSYRIVTY